MFLSICGSVLLIILIELRKVLYKLRREGMRFDRLAFGFDRLAEFDYWHISCK